MLHNLTFCESMLEQLIFDRRSFHSSLQNVRFFTKIPRVPRSVNGGELWFRIGFRKLRVFREAVKPRFVGGDRSLGVTLFTRQYCNLFVRFFVVHPHVKEDRVSVYYRGERRMIWNLWVNK